MHHQLSVATHTVELFQLSEINGRLAAIATMPTAADVGLEGGQAVVGTTVVPLPSSAVLAGLGWDGPPAYPYIHAHFLLDERSDPMLIDLHTAALRAISAWLGLRHVWGT